jgi:hypothetical protein
VLITEIYKVGDRRKNEEDWWIDTDKGKPILGEKPVPLLLCPPQIPHDLAWD